MTKKTPRPEPTEAGEYGATFTLADWIAIVIIILGGLAFMIYWLVDIFSITP